MVSSPVTLGRERRRKALQTSARPVQDSDHGQIAALLDRVHWDDLHLFNNLCSHPSLRKAAGAIGVSPNTLRARIDRLERTLDTLLFRRDRDGLKLTAAGDSVLRVARQMSIDSSAIPFGAGNNSLVSEGEIRICASEGLGTFWLTPRLPDLKARLPELVVSLDSYADQSMINPKRHDIALGFSRPRDPDTVASRLGFVHMIPFASEDYIRRKGHPRTIDDVVDHECVQQQAPGLHYDALALFLGEERARQLVTIQVGSSYSLFWAVASGVGIGALPTYVRSFSRRVLPLDLPIQLKFEIWLSYSQMARRSEPVRHAIEWLREAFDARLYPWFGEQFMHPNEFTASHADSQVVPLFDHLIDDPA